MLRELADVTARPLSVVFELSWQLEEVPEDWKTANTNSIFNKGRKENLTSYRPVCLSSVLAKVMEKMIL